MYSTIMDDMFDMFDLMSAALGGGYNNRFENKGLKTLISKPHNLYTIKDENGEITSYMIKLVYTPFTKDDITVDVKNDVLTVAIGKENKADEEGIVFKGISSQCSTFSLKITDANVDMKNISAKAEEGILTITLPVVHDKVLNSFNIAVN